jgi:tagaturonate reductase
LTAFPILQFGTSRFLQAHVDLFVSQALAQGEAMGRIAVVQTTSSKESRKRLDAFAAGKPYIVQVKGLARGKIVDESVEVTSVGAGFDAASQWDEVERLFIEAHCAVSNTADRGYETDPADRPDDGPPRSFPANLAKLLLVRNRAEPITLFPCELTPANGQALRAVVLDVLHRWDVSVKVRRWAEDECVWVNSLVDRIVSEPLEPVGAVTEPYARWAIEDQPGLELPCRHSSITVTGDLKSHERLKLFILNLGHTYVAEIWARGGAPTLTVREAMADNAIRAELNQLLDDEVLPVFAEIGMKEEAATYRATAVERFCNRFLDHRLAEIFVNHEAKKRRRLGGVIELAEGNNVRVKQPRLRAALGSAHEDRLSHTG